MPRMYATGSPASRRRTESSNRAAASAPTGASRWATIAVRSAPMAWPRSSSASRRAVSEPGSRSRDVAPDSSSPIVATVPSGSEPDRHGQVADLAEDLGAGRATPAVEEEIHRRLPDPEVVERHPPDPFRQVRVEELELAAAGVRIQAEHRLEEEERRAGRPGLRRAGDRIRDGQQGLVAVEPAEELRQPVVLAVQGSLE